MGGTSQTHATYAVLAIAAALLASPLSSCGTVGSLAGKDPEKEARDIASNDPMARPTQVAWTSARASRCGFIFDPARLRANYLAAETRAGNPPERAYDYTLQSVADIIKDDMRYCSPERTAAIRVDLNRYLGGDYTPSARSAR